MSVLCIQYQKQSYDFKNEPVFETNFCTPDELKDLQLFNLSGDQVSIITPVCRWQLKESWDSFERTKAQEELYNIQWSE